MLESATAIANAETIAAVPGIDVLLIGTNDLCVEMGVPGELGHTKVVDAYAHMDRGVPQARQVARDGRGFTTISSCSAISAWAPASFSPVAITGFSWTVPQSVQLSSERPKLK